MREQEKKLKKYGVNISSNDKTDLLKVKFEKGRRMFKYTKKKLHKKEKARQDFWEAMGKIQIIMMIELINELTRMYKKHGVKINKWEDFEKAKYLKIWIKLNEVSTLKEKRVKHNAKHNNRISEKNATTLPHN